MSQDLIINEVVAEQDRQLSAEDQELLRQANAELEQLQKQNVEAAKKAELLKQQNKQLRFEQNFSDQWQQTSREFHHSFMEGAESSVLKLIKNGKVDGVVVRSDDDGVPQITVNGRPSSLSAALEVVFADPDSRLMFFNTVDPMPAEGRNSEILSKADFRNTAHKANWLAANGLEKFEALPSSRDRILAGRNPNRLTANEYSKLSRSEKCRVIEMIGEAGISRIMSRR